MLQRYWKRLRRAWLHRKADVHLISFPKCGRTWLVLMIAKVIEGHYGISNKDPLKLHQYKRRARGLPLIIPHHDGGPEFRRPEALEKNKNRYANQKVIFLIRDPRDVTVSSYYQKTKRNINFRGSLREYVYEPVGGIKTILEFYNIWARNRHVPRDFLLVTYESLQGDPLGELRRVIDFLGLAGVGDETLEQAVEYCRFENMRRLESSNALGSKRLAPRDVSDETTYKTREGRVGGYVDHLEPEEVAYINGLLCDHLAPDFHFYCEEPRERSGAGE